MLHHGVEQVFGYQEGEILPSPYLMLLNSKHFNFIFPIHVQGAGNMAEGYARVSGIPVRE
ncbi:15987_t:CDS:2 [Funneliformis geosporum]|nr:15987_t:CDS:2 [Funneliformis geosporum]